MNLQKTTFKTPLGTMLAISDNHYLYLLQFTDSPRLEQQITKIASATQSKPVEKKTKISKLTQQELDAYFAGKLTTFTTPCKLIGSNFQTQAWQTLKTVPYGATRSYSQQAQALGKPTAQRAVANANGANPLVIIFSCHRIVSKHGTLGGYSTGIERKQWLLNHEKNFINLL